MNGKNMKTRDIKRCNNVLARIKNLAKKYKNESSSVMSTLMPEIKEGNIDLANDFDNLAITVQQMIDNFNDQIRAVRKAIDVAEKKAGIVHEPYVTSHKVKEKT